MWKVVRWRRRWPERDLGSVGGRGLVGGGCGKGREGRTVGIELEDVEVAVGVCYDEVELFSIGQEIGCDYFDWVGGFAEESKLVRWVFLFGGDQLSLCTF